ncbi:MAG: ammonium transporter [Campylobacter sp.]|nr:ammonium transporter [Campylobacter sp.]
MNILHKEINPSIEFEGLFISFNSHLLLEQIMGVVVCFGISAIISFVIFKVISYFTTLRVDSEYESLGLDASLHGESAYKR